MFYPSPKSTMNPGPLYVNFSAWGYHTVHISLELTPMFGVDGVFRFLKKICSPDFLKIHLEPETDPVFLAMPLSQEMDFSFL